MCTRARANVWYRRRARSYAAQAECIEEAVARHVEAVGGKHGSDGAKVGCVRFSSIEQLGSMVYSLYSAFEKKETDDKGKEISAAFDPPEYVLFIVDLSRALSDAPAREPAFFGTIETLLGKTLSTAKYRGQQLTWPNAPTVLIMSNSRPIQCEYGADNRVLRNDDGSLAFTPKCHLSAHRVRRNIYTVAWEGERRVLLQDTVCDELAAAVRKWEEATQQAHVDEINGVTPPTAREVFMEQVMCNYTPFQPALLPKAEWTSYDHLYKLFEKASPVKVAKKGPNNLKQLIAEWFKGHAAFCDADTGEPLRHKDWCDRLHVAGDHAANRVCKFSFKHTPGAGPPAAENFADGGAQQAQAE